MIKTSVKVGAAFGFTAGYIIALFEFRALTMTHSLSNRSLGDLGLENLLCPILIYILALLILGISASLMIAAVLKWARISWSDSTTRVLGCIIFLPSWYYSVKVQSLISSTEGSRGLADHLKTYLPVTLLFICLFLLIIRMTPQRTARAAGKRHTGLGLYRIAYIIILVLFPLLLLHDLIGSSLKDLRLKRQHAQEITAGKPGVNVLLITIDTLRQDYLGCYNPGFVRTPVIDEIAKEGVRFEHVFAPAPLTLPSHTSILTGEYPKKHGVRTNIRHRILDASEITLAELLSENGFKTAAFVGATVINRNSGLAQGFDFYGDTFDHMWYKLFKQGRQILPKILIRLRLMKKSDLLIRQADEVSDKALEWLRDYGESRFFLWLHYFDPHRPYRPPKEFADMYLGNPSTAGEGSDRASRERALYKAEVSYTDFQIGRVLQELKSMGVMDNTLIIITADHGQSLGEHDYHGHTDIIYEQTMRIPLIMRLPGLVKEGAVINQLVSNVDIAPTVLDILSIPLDDRIDGTSLLPSIRGMEQGGHDMVFLETMHGEKEGKTLVGVRDLKWKLIKGRPHMSVELFDLGVDSTETHNLADSSEAVFDSLDDALNRFFGDEEELQEEQDQKLEPDLEENLRALGYIGDS